MELAITPLQAGGIIPRGTRINVFQQIYWVFLILGTLVGVVVIGYMLQKAYKYRDTGVEDDDDRPQLGELPSGGGKGRKLFLSFAVSTIIVVSLVAWTYGTLLYVEQGAAQSNPGQGEPIEVEVVGYQFGWQFTYEDVPGQENGVQTNGELRVPADRMIELTVTSRDVFHNFGVPGLRVKTDAIPGQTTSQWFMADETGTHAAKCYELCGAGHSYMNGEVVVMEPGEFRNWYANAANETAQ